MGLVPGNIHIRQQQQQQAAHALEPHYYVIIISGGVTSLQSLLYVQPGHFSVIFISKYHQDQPYISRQLLGFCFVRIFHTVNS